MPNNPMQPFGSGGQGNGPKWVPSRPSTTIPQQPIQEPLQKPTVPLTISGNYPNIPLGLQMPNFAGMQMPTSFGQQGVLGAGSK